jgi:hypothetical protein
MGMGSLTSERKTLGLSALNAEGAKGLIKKRLSSLYSA